MNLLGNAKVTKFKLGNNKLLIIFPGNYITLLQSDFMVTIFKLNSRILYLNFEIFDLYLTMAVLLDVRMPNQGMNSYHKMSMVSKNKTKSLHGKVVLN